MDTNCNIHRVSGGPSAIASAPIIRFKDVVASAPCCGLSLLPGEGATEGVWLCNVCSRAKEGTRHGDCFVLLEPGTALRKWDSTQFFYRQIQVQVLLTDVEGEKFRDYCDGDESSWLKGSKHVAGTCTLQEGNTKRTRPLPSCVRGNGRQ